MEPYAEWMTLWLYDHSGITMSCGARVEQYADRWDSGCVGWIVALKETVMREMAEYVLDKNGVRIRIEHKHEGAPSTWSYLTRALTDKTWRDRAIEAMKGDVELYDKMLTGDVYGYTLYERAVSYTHLDVYKRQLRLSRQRRIDPTSPAHHPRTRR